MAAGKPPRRRTFSAADPAVGMTLDDLSEFLDEMRALDLPGETPVRCVGTMKLDMADGPILARITADPALVTS